MKKCLAILLVFVLLFSMMVGCGAKPTESGVTPPPAETGADTVPEAPAAVAPDREPVMLRFWAGIPPEAGPQLVVDAFNEAFADRGIAVEYERYVNDEQGNLKLETALLAGSDLDVYVSYGDANASKRVGAGMALDMSAYMERDGFDYEGNFGSDALNSYYDGTASALYTISVRQSLLVNKDMFDAAGIPIPESWTFEEFRDAARKLTHGEGQDKVYGMYWHTPQDPSLYLSFFVTATLGGNWAYSDDYMSTRLNDPVIQAPLKLMYDTMHIDESAPTHVDSVTQKLTLENMFLSGRSAMIVGNWVIRSVKNLEEFPHDFKTAYVPYPIISPDQVNYANYSLGDIIMINSKTKYPEEAWEFVNWYATEGVKYMAVGGRIALSKTVNPDEVMQMFVQGAEDLIDADSVGRVLLAPVTLPTTIPSFTERAPEIYRVLAEEIENTLTRQKDIGDALNDAKSRADQFLE